MSVGISKRAQRCTLALPATKPLCQTLECFCDISDSTVSQRPKS